MKKIIFMLLLGGALMFVSNSFAGPVSEASGKKCCGCECCEKVAHKCCKGKKCCSGKKDCCKTEASCCKDGKCESGSEKSCDQEKGQGAKKSCCK